ncbi:PAAR domain-containing protein [Tateyamaria sp. ANG-S1]|uniref:PAAR domain-containing protein n=1 Tax=Tateyamaria sp. ANG-S1 TaxID=1577905 RepID=UPI0009E4FC2F|nr:PAAR domain-containing protein [Tateyamaria sp. ANG-S1]
MPPAHRKGDIGSGHGCHFPPTPATGGSPDVFVNGKPLMRQGDSFASHACVRGHARTHSRALSSGSVSVFVNGSPAGRKGDSINCGGVAETASPDVFIGDTVSSGAGAKTRSFPFSARKPQCQRSMAAAGMPFLKP